MQVVETEGFVAWCEGRGRRERLNMLLVGPQPAGAWVLAFLGSARELLTPEQAAQINDALDALEAALQGETDFSAYFQDLEPARGGGPGKLAN